MNAFRRTKWAIAAALMACAGCGSSSKPARDIRVIADPPYSEPVVVLAEVEGISDTAGDRDPQRHWIKNSSFLTRPAGVFTLRTVPSSITGFFWSYWGERQRWTLFSPGRAAVTLYPDDGYADVNQPSYANLAVTHYATQLAPDGPSVEESFDPDSKQLILRLPSSAAPTIPTVMRPLSITERNTLPPGLTSPLLFAQQVRAVRAALASGGLTALDGASHRVLRRAIEMQKDALVIADVLQHEDQLVVDAVLQGLIKAEAGEGGK